MLLYMKYILLCGGIGKRCNQYSLPKPLNLINGKHLIELIIESIPSNIVYIIYNIILDNYNFKEIIINKFKNRQFIFSCVDFTTRGAIETAYIGLNKLNINDDENILFIDNDNIHSFPQNNYVYDSNFIGYGIDYNHTNFSFITIENNNVTNIEEKNKISNNYCCGLYGFKSTNTFLSLAHEVIMSNFKTKNEFYFSQIYKLLINKKENIIPFFVKDTKHLGTYNEIICNNNLLPKKKLRICFDLDNTLVTYPTIPNDYSSVKPINKNINLLKKLKKDGHEIIIFTARRMLTHNHNIGKVIKDIAMVTFETLLKFDIEYDEILFGKPIADIYIDDRALNPYFNDINMFGLFNYDDHYIQNKIENNKYNKIEKIDNVIIKKGPIKFIKGELFFYQNIPKKFEKYFPKLYDYNKMEDIIEIKIEYIEGIPLYYLYKNQTFSTKIIDNLFKILNEFNDNSVIIENNNTYEMIKKNYINKLHDRFNTSDYPFEDANEVFNNIINGLTTNFDPIISSFIHGDLWFSNIILSYDDSYKFVDMKGQLYNNLTLSGDKYYDFGKLYQSIIGYDLILNKDTINYNFIKEMELYFLKKCNDINLNITYLKYVTKSLIFGVFHSLNVNSPKKEIWELLKSII